MKIRQKSSERDGIHMSNQLKKMDNKQQKRCEDITNNGYKPEGTLLSRENSGDGSAQKSFFYLVGVIIKSIY